MEQLVFSSKEVSLNKVLDLTDAEVRNRIGVGSERITLDRDQDPNAYETTQMIGSIAKELGYDAIKAPSAKSSLNNLIILKGI